MQAHTHRRVAVAVQDRRLRGVAAGRVLEPLQLRVCQHRLESTRFHERERERESECVYVTEGRCSCGFASTAWDQRGSVCVCVCVCVYVCVRVCVCVV